MKIKQTLTLILFGMTTLVAQAQVATINSQKVLSSIPEVAKIDTLSQKELTRLDAEFQLKQKAVQEQQALVAAAQAKSKSKSEAAKQLVEEMKLKTLQQESQDYQKKANKEYNDYRDLLYKPYIEKITTAIKTVAQNKKIMQVVDVQQVSFIYTDESADITGDVIRELQK